MDKKKNLHTITQVLALKSMFPKIEEWKEKAHRFLPFFQPSIQEPSTLPLFHSYPFVVNRKKISSSVIWTGRISSKFHPFWTIVDAISGRISDSSP